MVTSLITEGNIMKFMSINISVFYMISMLFIENVSKIEQSIVPKYKFV